RVVAATLPRGGVDRVSACESEHITNRVWQRGDKRLHGLQDVVAMGRVGDGGPGAWRSCRDDHWRNRGVVAGFVEVLEVQRVIAGLIKGRGGELVLTYLEFDDEDDRTDDRQNVNPLSQARNGVLEVDGALVPVGCQRHLENVDLLAPSGRL